MSQSLIPRREERHLLPFSSVVLKAELVANRFSYLGYLWDVSSSGACLCLSEDAEILTNGEEVSIRFHGPKQDQSLTSTCRIAWLNTVHGARFVGVELTETMDLTSTFFHQLLSPRYLQQAGPN
jgi:hypothetical protein